MYVGNSFVQFESQSKDSFDQIHANKNFKKKIGGFRI